MIYKLTSNLEEIDRKNLLLRGEGNSAYLRGYKELLRKGKCLVNTKHITFHLEVWRLRTDWTMIIAWRQNKSQTLL